MMNETNSKSACCSISECACGDQVSKKSNDTKRYVVIDFLYLDLNVCERCMGTESTLDESLNDMATILESIGIEVIVNKINVNSEELAILHQFKSSPTIRINGKDIQLEIKENNCQSCGDLCGDEIDCRTFTYQGIDYDSPPKAMIIESILKAMYANDKKFILKTKYIMPENLRQFYTAMNKKTNCCK